MHLEALSLHVPLVVSVFGLQQAADLNVCSKTRNKPAYYKALMSTICLNTSGQKLCATLKFHQAAMRILYRVGCSRAKTNKDCV